MIVSWHKNLVYGAIVDTDSLHEKIVDMTDIAMDLVAYTKFLYA